VLAEPNVTDLVTLLGTNDLGMGSSADQVLRGLDDILAQGRVRGTAVWVGTILPRVGSSWSTTAERARQQVNAALRGRWLTDRGGRLIDTDKALQNPASPTRLLPAYDSGDHLHPSAAGERAIGAAVLTRLGTTALLSSAPTAVPTPGSPAPKAPSSGATGPIAVTSPAPTGTPSTSGGILGAVVRAVRHLW
jgi:hypothetical protein